MLPSQRRPAVAKRLLAFTAAALCTSLATAAAQDWNPTGAAPSQEVTLHQAFDYAFPLVAMGRL
ncbi:MAG: hypothetical protein ACOC8J_19485, partial [Ralstonia sp.]